MPAEFTADQVRDWARAKRQEQLTAGAVPGDDGKKRGPKYSAQNSGAVEGETGGDQEQGEEGAGGEEAKELAPSLRDQAEDADATAEALRNADLGDHEDEFRERVDALADAYGKNANELRELANAIEEAEGEEDEDAEEEGEEAAAGEEEMGDDDGGGDAD